MQHIGFPIRLRAMLAALAHYGFLRIKGHERATPNASETPAPTLHLRGDVSEGYTNEAQGPDDAQVHGCATRSRPAPHSGAWNGSGADRGGVVCGGSGSANLE